MNKTQEWLVETRTMAFSSSNGSTKASVRVFTNRNLNYLLTGFFKKIKLISMDKLFEARRKNYIEIGKIYFWTATINKWQKLLEKAEFK